MGEGLHLILPWDQFFLYDRRLQTFSDSYTAISRDGVNISVTMNIRYRLNRETIPQLHEGIGPDYLKALIVPEVGNRLREVLADFTAEQIYSLDRTNIQRDILSRTQARMAAEAHLGAGEGQSYVFMYDTLVLGIELPPAVVDAIERKIGEFYLSEAYDYRILQERKEADRKRIEAEGIRDFQTIVSQGISDSYLRFRGIEATLQLAQSNNAKVVIIGGGKDGVPIILSGADSPAAAPAPAAPAAKTESKFLLPKPAAPTASKAPEKQAVADSWPTMLTQPVRWLVDWFAGRPDPDTHPAPARP
jgi:regulator of protease activity HflC (stomatin/prohibitin superfamily)